MKKLKIFVCLWFSFIPLGQPILIGTTFSLASSALFFSKAAKANIKNAAFFYERGSNKLEKENYKGAISDYTKAIKINPEYGEAYQERGYAKEMLKNYEGAISDYTKAIKINPYNGEAYMDLHYVKISIEDYTGALSARNKALEIYSNDKVKLSIKDIIAPEMLNTLIAQCEKVLIILLDLMVKHIKSQLPITFMIKQEKLIRKSYQKRCGILMKFLMMQNNLLWTSFLKLILILILTLRE